MVNLIMIPPLGQATSNACAPGVPATRISVQAPLAENKPDCRRRRRSGDSASATAHGRRRSAVFAKGLQGSSEEYAYEFVTSVLASVPRGRLGSPGACAYPAIRI